MRARAAGEQVTPMEFRFLLLPACYREDTPQSVDNHTNEEWVVFPDFSHGLCVGGIALEYLCIIDFFSSRPGYSRSFAAAYVPLTKPPSKPLFWPLFHRHLLEQTIARYRYFWHDNNE